MFYEQLLTEVKYDELNKIFVDQQNIAITLLVKQLYIKKSFCKYLFLKAYNNINIFYYQYMLVLKLFIYYNITLTTIKIMSGNWLVLYPNFRWPSDIEVII